MMIEIPGKLEIDTKRGVVYFHALSEEVILDWKTQTIVRIQGLNPLYLLNKQPIDIRLDAQSCESQDKIYRKIDDELSEEEMRQENDSARLE